MKTIRQEYLINASVERVWRALVDPKEIDKWGAGPAKMDDKVGTKFSLWGGEVHGTNTKVEKNKLLQQDWFGGDWKEPSIVRFVLSEKEGKTKVELVHENVPDDEHDDIDDGWKRYYLGPLKKYLEK
ncbi:MAG: SRPBCC domain-containing protein [Candidatus Levybacteria bacterium]|nr:SRPBCC domain-containing protein [Candidatus Levybacteria bacterium]